MITAENLEERAERGAAWLDDVYRGWEHFVHVDDLDMADDTSCVAGQLFGRFIDTPLSDEDLASHGFYVDIEEVPDDVLFPTVTLLRAYQMLDDIWTDLIEARRARNIQRILDVDAVCA